MLHSCFMFYIIFCLICFIPNIKTNATYGFCIHLFCTNSSRVNVVYTCMPSYLEKLHQKHGSVLQFFLFSLFYYNKLKSTITHIKQNSKSNSNNNKKHLSCIFLFFVHVALKKKCYMYFISNAEMLNLFFFSFIRNLLLQFVVE